MHFKLNFIDEFRQILIYRDLLQTTFMTAGKHGHHVGLPYFASRLYMEQFYNHLDLKIICS